MQTTPLQQQSNPTVTLVRSGCAPVEWPHSIDLSLDNTVSHKTAPTECPNSLNFVVLPRTNHHARIGCFAGTANNWQHWHGQSLGTVASKYGPSIGVDHASQTKFEQFGNAKVAANWVKANIAGIIAEMAIPCPGCCPERNMPALANCWARSSWQAAAK